MTGQRGLHLASQRQSDPKRRAAPNFRIERNRTIVQLDRSEGAREPDSASSRPRRKEQLEDPLPVLGSDAAARVPNFDLGHFSLPAKRNEKLASSVHGVDGVHQ